MNTCSENDLSTHNFKSFYMNKHQGKDKSVLFLCEMYLIPFKMSKNMAKGFTGRNRMVETQTSHQTIRG